MTFAEELKQWRGTLRQKEIVDLFGVPLVTYQAWERGSREPKDLTKSEMRWRMAAYKKGESVQAYKAKYLQIIQQVVSEILTKPKVKTP